LEKLSKDEPMGTLILCI